MSALTYYALPGVVKVVSPPIQLTPDYIIDCICKDRGLLLYELKTRMRKRDVVFARQLICWYLRKLTPLSLKSVGDLLGGRDHTTVIHSCRTIVDLIFSDESVQKTIAFYDEKFNHAQRRKETIADLLAQGQTMAAPQGIA